jgi:hypothetical protein
MRSLPLAAAALIAALPAAAQEASGYVQTERGRLEIGAGGGFFGTARAAPAPPPFDSAALRSRRTEGGTTAHGAAAPRPTPADPCRRERSAYLRQLLRATGVDLDDPLALLDGLAGPGGYDAAELFTPYGLVPGVDPIQPLAWDSTLRTLANDLTRCTLAAR